MKTINLGEPLEPITIPPVDLERNPWSASGDPRKIDAKKIKDLEVETITMSDDGYFRSGKLAFNDTSNAGWYQSSKGIYMGTAGDTKSLKYDVLAGTIVFKGVDLSWSDITGAGKPANNATVGAKAGTNLVDSSGGQLSDTDIKNQAIADGTYEGGTFISEKNIYSPKISAGTITGAIITAKNGATEVVKLNSSGLGVYGQYATWYSGTTAVGQIYADTVTNLQIASYVKKTLQLIGGGGVDINAGSRSLDLKYGNSTKLKIDSSITSSANISMGTYDISGIGTATATKVSVGGASDLTYSDSKLQISTNIKVAGSVFATGAIECSDARIKVGSYDLYPTAGEFDPSKYYLRS